MMHAADSPWTMRPASSMPAVRPPMPSGVSAMSRDPTMLRPMPIMRIRPRPTRSASPPATTMKMPENREVIETARLAIVGAMPSSPWMPGMTLSRVWANSQKVMTERTIPASHRLVGFQAVAADAGAEVVMSASSHFRR